jgi:uncharacterized protein (TIGR02145 family)
MKKIVTVILFLINLIAFSQVGIGTSNPIASAALDISSTTKGLIPPRMTYDQKIAIISPATGLIIWCTDCGSYGEMQVFNGTVWANMAGGAAGVQQLSLGGTAICDDSRATKVVELTSSTGKVWMDRNLGASRAAISSTDYMAYGCLYQWGRGNDGHANLRWWSSDFVTYFYGVTTTLAIGDTPGHALFIRTSSSPFDWRADNNNTRWQAGTQVNNPCPTGFHVPSNTELLNEFSVYNINNSNSAFTNGPGGGFKFTIVGLRSTYGNVVEDGEAAGYYWTSSVYNIQNSSYEVIIDGTSITNTWESRALGLSVRCIKD